MDARPRGRIYKQKEKEMTKYNIKVVNFKREFPLSWCELMSECWYEKKPFAEGDTPVLFLKGEDHTIFVVNEEYYPLRVVEVTNVGWISSAPQYREVNVKHIEFEIER